MTLIFDAVEHAYHLDGVRIPSVTQILSHGQDLSRIPAWTAQRGTALHLCTELYDENDLDPESVDPLVQPHLDAYIDWHKRTKPKYIATEVKVWGQIDGLAFAGTVDRVRELRPGTLQILDVKSGKPRGEHGPQVQAYRLAWQQMTGHADIDCAGLYCPKDGEAYMKSYNESHHLETFKEKLHRYYKEEK